jgi:hypothetical protein
VTPAIKEYIEDKITKAIHNFAHTLKSVDVTISARGGDTGTHGARYVGVGVCGGEGGQRGQGRRFVKLPAAAPAAVAAVTAVTAAWQRHRQQPMQQQWREQQQQQ